MKHIYQSKIINVIDEAFDAMIEWEEKYTIVRLFDSVTEITFLSDISRKTTGVRIDMIRKYRNNFIRVVCFEDDHTPIHELLSFKTPNDKHTALSFLRKNDILPLPEEFREMGLLSRFMSCTLIDEILDGGSMTEN